MTPPAVSADRRVLPHVVAVAALATLALAGAAGALRVSGLSGWTLGYAASFAVGVFVVQQVSIPFDWKGQRITVSLEEGVVFLALLTMPVALLPFVALAPGVATQVVARRRPLKAVFNVSTNVLAAGLSAGLFALLTLSLGLAPLLAVFPALAAYSVSTNLAVARLFSLLEGEPTLRVFRERFVLPAALQFAVGSSLGVVMAGLWIHHPLAVVAVLPFVFLAKGYAGLAARADRELLVHRRLVGVSHELVGKPEVEPAVEHLLESCGSLFGAGEATLVLHDEEGGERAWTRGFEAGPDPASEPLSIPIPRPEGGPMGTLTLLPRRPGAYGAMEQELLKVVAAQASAVLSNATALARILVLKNLHEGIVRNVPAGVLRVDGEGRVVQANPALLAMLSEDAPPVGPAYDWRPFAAHPRLCEDLKALVEQGVPFYELELAPEGPGGRVLSLSGVPLPAGGEDAGSEDAGGAVLLASDVTARKQAEEAMRRQMLTKPIVRRIVLDLVGRVGASARTIAEVGRSLAKEVQGTQAEDFAHAFRAMGLGDLRLDKREGDTYTFVADDLLERQRKSTQPTCHLASGYVEGIVASLHRGAALGSEIRCQSQGHPRCVFVAKPREVVVPARRVAFRREK